MSAITPDDITQMQKYIQELDELKKREPHGLPAETWDQIWPIIKATGDVPEEYKNKIGKRTIIDPTDPEDIPMSGFYDIEVSQWEHEVLQLTVKYHDTIAKAINFTTKEKANNFRQAVTECLQQVINENDAPNPRSKAIEKGALLTIGGHVAAYSADEFKNSLNGISLFRLPTDIMQNQAAFFDSKGKLNALMLEKIDLIELNELQTGTLLTIVRAVELSEDFGGNTVSLYLPSILREMRIDGRAYSSKRPEKKDDENALAELRFNTMLSLIMPFDPLVGRTPDGSYYRLMTFEEYDPDSETFIINAPYLYKLKELTTGKQNQLHKLLHSNVANEKNGAAVELANRVLQGIVTRGTRRPDPKTYRSQPNITKKTITKTNEKGEKTTTTLTYASPEPTETQPEQPNIFTYAISYATLINECPQLKRELEDIERRGDKSYQGEDKIERLTQTYNKKLQDVFTAAFRIIETKSDAPIKYLNFTLPKVERTVKGERKVCYDYPTKSTLKRNMVITYKGRNPRFKD